MARSFKRRCKGTTFSGALAGKCRTSPHNAALNYTKPDKQESLLRQFRQLNRQLLTMHEYVFHTKIRCASLATKIFKNIGILFKTIIDNLMTIIDNFRVVFGAAATFHLGIAR